MKKLLSMCFVAAMLLAGCGGEESKEKEKLTVLTNSGYPPYEVVDNKGNLSGFDIDIINAIAEETGYESVEKRLISLRFISPEKLHKTICYILKRTVLLLKMI